ncbi:MAG: hypothetical protein ACRDD1_12125, partial [Planctomycetia bacterium]
MMIDEVSRQRPEASEVFMNPLRAAVLVAAAITALGCLGPASIRKVRPHYNEAVGRTDREEFLLNIVRLRYVQPPEFVAVAGIVAQYEASFGAEFTGGVDEAERTLLGVLGVGGSDDPTISYAPQAGPDFGKSLLTPARLEDVLFLAEGGWSLDRLFRLTLHRMNGRRNANDGHTILARAAPPFEDFNGAARLLGDLQRRGRAEVSIEVQDVAASDPIPTSQVRGRDLVEAAKEKLAFRTHDDGSTMVLMRRRRIYALRIPAEFLGEPDVVELERRLGL